MKLIIFMAIFTCITATPQRAFAGDGATIIFKSGEIVYLNNGFKQLDREMSTFTKKGTENYYLKMELEGSSFYINLGTIAILCRDRCKSMDIIQKRRDQRKTK